MTNPINQIPPTSEGVYVLPWAGYASAVTYTFDDAQPSQAAHLDELTATGARMTFFVNSNVSFPGSDAAWKRAVSAGHELANHTASHPHLPPDGEMSSGCFGETAADPEAELDRCDRFIAEMGQDGSWTFATPYGDEGWEPVAARRFELVRSVAKGTVPAGAGIQPSHVPCLMAMPEETADGVFIPAIDAARAEGSWLVFCFHSILPTQDNWYAGIDIAEISKSVAHALASGDVWVDTFANVGFYWLARNLFEALEPSVEGDLLVWRWSVPCRFPKGIKLRVIAPGGTLSQGARVLSAAETGYYDVEFDAEELRFSPAR